MTKHILIQSNPPEDDEVGEHPLLPNPLEEVPVHYGEDSEKVDPYGKTDTGELKTGNIGILDKLFVGLPVKMMKNDEEG